jgi:hypothetical protein
MNSYQLLKCATYTLVLAVQILLFPIAATAQSTAFTITPIVKRGDPSADGGRFFDCDDCEGRINGSHAFNNRGDVALAADVVSGSCFINRYLVSGGQSFRVADFCHATEFGKLTLLGLLNLNDQAQVAINTGVTVNNKIVEMLLLYSNGTLTKIVEEGDTSPIGTIFKGCGFGEPAINNKGEVAFFACGETKDGFFSGDGAYMYSGGEIRKVVVSNDPSPIGGTFALNFIPAQAVHLNDNGDVLFRAGVILDPTIKEKLGLFLATTEGVRKIEVDGDPMPGGGVVKENTLGIGDLNNKGEAVFAVALSGGTSDLGIFLNSAGQIKKVMVVGDSSPIGGSFSALRDPQRDQEFPIPRINDNSAVVFKAVVTNGSAPAGLFLASPKAIVKVVAIGDQIATGETIRVIDTFALNDLGQVAFFAYGKKDKTKPLGVYVATPVSPQIKKIKLKSKRGVLELRVNGNAMITNDTVIEINGVPLGAIDYPSDFREDGGFTTRVVSRDPRLEQLISSGQTVQVTVFNSLTNRRSEAKAFTR